MKKIIILLIGFILILSSQAFAHGGKTDSNGGHRDNYNASGLGSYHYHCDGYPAHLHTDGICPHSASSQTTQSVSEKLRKEMKDNGLINSTPEPVIIHSPTHSKEETDPLKWLETIFWSACLISPITAVISWTLSASKKEKTAHFFSTISKFSLLLILIILLYLLIGEIALLLLIFAIPGSFKNFLYLLAEGLTDENEDNKNNASLIPPEYIIGPWGLPADKNAPKHWGKTFTVYVEPDTNLYHRGRCHCVTPERTYPSHILRAIKDNQPCSLCNPEIPDLSWYYDWLNNKNQK